MRTVNFIKCFLVIVILSVFAGCKKSEEPAPPTPEPTVASPAEIPAPSAIPAPPAAPEANVPAAAPAPPPAPESNMPAETNVPAPPAAE